MIIHKYSLLLASGCLTSLLILATLGAAQGGETFIVPDDFATLQNANDSAIVPPGSRILIATDTPGATITKRLIIEGMDDAQGMPLGVVGSAFFGSGENNQDIRFAGIALTSRASGTIIRNVTIGGNSLIATPPVFGVITGGALQSAASNITVERCTILDTFQGVSGTCGTTDDMITTTCPRGWLVQNNEITLNTGSTPIYAYIGISAFNTDVLGFFPQQWVIRGNMISRENTQTVGGPERAFTGATGINSFASYGARIHNVIIANNRCAVRGFFDFDKNGRFDPSEESATAIEVTAGSYGDDCCGLAFNTETQVIGNDERGSDFQTSVFASRDPAATGHDLSKLHQYDYLPFDVGRVNLVMIKDNILPGPFAPGKANGSGNRSLRAGYPSRGPVVPTGGRLPNAP
ncbi:MAG: hypothetical protein HY650_10605 [Acidobacteria bacterium]|nr:hypothetical protein [Acidobacteriota bacterium]